jgi:UPF0716 protein FxsA
VAWILIALIVVPIAELAVLIQVGSEIGVWWTIALLLAVSFVGSWLVKREGLGLWASANRELAAGRMPTKQLLDGILVLFAGALLLTPGFLTDIVGILLLLPPTRAVLRRVLRARFERRMTIVALGAPGGGAAYDARRRPPGGDVIDVDPLDAPDAPDR